MSRKIDMSVNIHNNMSDQEQNNNINIEVNIKHEEESEVQNNNMITSSLSKVKPEVQVSVDKIAQSSDCKEVSRTDKCCSSSDNPSTHGRETPKNKYNKRHPWITDEFLEMVERRDELHLKLKINPSNEVFKKEFSLLRNRTAALRRKLKQAYQMYLEEL